MITIQEIILESFVMSLTMTSFFLFEGFSLGIKPIENEKVKLKRVYLSLNSQSGFTLLELLLVVFILAAIALGTVSFTNNADEQFRYEDTRTRLENIRRAVVGQSEQTLNGEPAISGFVADIGRLPNNLPELIEQGTLSSWQIDSSADIFAGWRGPYLTAFAEQSSGEKAFRDGWSNPGNGAANYGWFFEHTTTIDNDVPPDGVDRTLRIQSLGSDGVSGNPSSSTYGGDYPADVLTDSADDFIQPSDYLLNLNGWGMKVKFFNRTGAPYAGGDVVRLRLYYPQGGNFSWQTWPGDDTARDASVFISESQILPAINQDDFVEITFGSFGNGDNFIPWGVRSLFVVENDTGGPFRVVTTGQKEVINIVPRRQLPKEMVWPFQ